MSNALIVGGATAWLEEIEGQESLVFGVREESRRIAALGSPVETELRAALELVDGVLVVPAVLRLGPEVSKHWAKGENLYEVWLNAHATDMPGVFALAGQSRLIARLFGDRAKLERTIACPNSRREFFVAAAAQAAAIAPWSMDAFDQARAKVEAKFPSVRALWQAMAPR